MNYTDQQIERTASALGWALVILLLCAAIVVDCTNNQARGNTMRLNTGKTVSLFVVTKSPDSTSGFQFIKPGDARDFINGEDRKKFFKDSVYLVEIEAKIVDHWEVKV